MIDSVADALQLTGGKTLSLVRQTETMECGHACLAMILQYYGHDIDIASMRARYPASAKGTTLKRIMQMADHLKLVSRPLRLELEDLGKLKTPCILHWDMNHFVVLQSINKSKVIIYDPARGKLQIPITEVDRSFTGVALELEPSVGFEKKREKVQLKLQQLVTSLRGLWSNLAQIFLLSIVLQVIALLGPYHTQLVIDKVLPSSDYNLLAVLGVGFIVLVFFHQLVDGIRSWVIMYLGSLLNFHLINRLFQQMIRLPLDYFEKRHIGDIQSRFGSLSEIEKLFTTGFVSSVVDGIMVVITLTLMFSYSLELSLIALASTLVYATIQFALYKPIRNATEEQIMYGAKQDTHFLETLRAMQAIKIFGKEGQRHQDWSNKYVESMNAGIRLNKINIISGTVQGFLTGVEGVVIVWVAGSALLSSSFSVGMFFAFMAFRARFSSQAQGLLSSLFQFLMVRLHLYRIADLALQEREKNTDTPTLIQEGGDTSISLQKLSFRYSESEDYILRNLELDIKANECVAITGASGVGKTTLLKIMMGLLGPTEGKVLVGGKPLHQIGLKGYRAITAAVMQNDQLLAGSILQNICFFDIEVDLNKVIEMAKTASIWDEIEPMPMGLHTHIGDMGSALSGGQQQRILLARALYKQPKILFMDEGTSHLDIQTEQCINRAISNLNITRIIIAHRQETLQLADRVLHLVDGRLSTIIMQ